MAMDEFGAVLKARELVKKVNPAAIPVPVEDLCPACRSGHPAAD